MALATRRRTRVVIAVLALALLGAIVDGVRWWRAERWNDAIATGRLPTTPAAGLPEEVRFAQAAAQAASGAEEGALHAYRALQSSTAIGQAARYNGANVLMRQAFRVRATDQPGQAIPLIELAKEGYREILRNDPAQWDARYNLERAQRLLPDPDDADTSPAEGSRNAERAATTMRGYSPGLP
jgi:mxaK protein